MQIRNRKRFGRFAVTSPPHSTLHTVDGILERLRVESWELRVRNSGGSVSDIFSFSVIRYTELEKYQNVCYSVILTLQK